LLGDETGSQHSRVSGESDHSGRSGCVGLADRPWRALGSGAAVRSRPDPSPSGLRSSGLTLVNRVDPGDLLRLLDRFDVEIDDDRLVVAPYQYAFQRLVAGRVDL